MVVLIGLSGGWFFMKTKYFINFDELINVKKKIEFKTILWAVWAVTEAILLYSCIVYHFYLGQSLFLVYESLFVMIGLLPALFLFQYNKFHYSSSWYLLTLQQVCIFVSWKIGPFNELLMLFNLLVVFCSVLCRNYKVMIVISGLFVLNILVINIFEGLNFVTFNYDQKTFYSFLVIHIFFYCISYFVYKFQKDLAGVVARVQKKKTNVEEQEQEIQRLILYDTLTGLPNHVFASDHCNYKINQAKRSKTLVGVLVIDIDDFAFIKNNYDKKKSDMLLVTIAQRLKYEVQGDGVVCRFSFDEFVIVSGDHIDKNTVTLLAHKVIRIFADGIEMKNVKYFLSCSIGIALHTQDGDNFSNLYQNAHVAMRKVKNSGKNGFKFFGQKIDQEDARLSILLTDAKSALENNQLELYYQPQIDLTTGRLAGVEALLRWNHPKIGFVVPSEFIFLFEKSGLIHSIGDWVLERVYQQIMEWRLTAIAPMKMSINVSPLQMLKEDFVSKVVTTFKDLRCSDLSICIELTESFAMQNTKKLCDDIDILNRNNIEVSIDDFGAGYSNLGYLTHFNMSILKIDRSFIQNIETNQRQQIVVESIIKMAHSLGVSVTAEGIETDLSRSILTNMGCDYGQGYFWSPPLNTNDFIGYMCLNHDCQ